eukprot:TRINITY_DN997_c0_g2_i11.p1 TRINITY_DN997_c0_g2~~TRINITY_DN997_c0_g2_i11.p1  ORF type:complete len:276 (-),score=49.78 TRINITY_DN997_c0_g2_i11:425-1252(-)
MMTRGSFSEYLAGLKQPRLNICQNWFQQILTGLSTLHKKRITHGKLSCEHIFINSNTGEVKIGDLSLVKLEEIISNRLLPHRPVDDIHQFGLLLLEIAFFGLMPNKRLKSLINKYYDSITFDTKKASSLAQYIEDDSYKSLLLYCIGAGSSTTALDVLGHPFFSKSFAREETLRVAKTKERHLTESTTPSAARLESPAKKSIAVIANALKPLHAARIDISLKITTRDTDVLISFEYNMEVDSPERVGQEMKEVLGLPEVYIVAFQERLKQARIIC